VILCTGYKYGRGSVVVLDMISDVDVFVELISDSDLMISSFDAIVKIYDQSILIYRLTFKPVPKNSSTVERVWRPRTMMLILQGIISLEGLHCCDDKRQR
jgi:hypothetical protein